MKKLLLLLNLFIISSLTIAQPPYENDWIKYNQEYYRQFRLIQRRATMKYAMQTAEFPVTLIQVAESDVAARCRALIPQLEAHQVGGDHFSMLQPPHVDGLAAIVANAAS